MRAMIKHHWAFFKQLPLLVIPATGFAIGDWLDGMEDERMTKFRDKSALYGKVLAPGEKPSWP